MNIENSFGLSINEIIPEYFIFMELCAFTMYAVMKFYFKNLSKFNESFAASHFP